MLVGNALGGEIAWQTTVLAPERVSKLVLINSDGYTQSALSMPLAFQMAGARGWRWVAERIMPQGCGCVQCAQCVRRPQQSHGRQN